MIAVDYTAIHHEQTEHIPNDLRQAVAKSVINTSNHPVPPFPDDVIVISPVMLGIIDVSHIRHIEHCLQPHVYYTVYYQFPDTFKTTNVMSHNELSNFETALLWNDLPIQWRIQELIDEEEGGADFFRNLCSPQLENAPKGFRGSPP